MHVKKAFLIHGVWGTPNENWLPWLRDQLVKKGLEVHAPQFPAPPEHSLDSWLAVFKEYMPMLDSSSIMVGHSMGPAFILSVLERIDVQVAACFFVAPFAELLGIEKFDNVNRTFIDKRFDWAKIRRNCKEFHIYCSDNDPYVPIELSRKLADSLGASITVVHGAGHFNKAAGYDSDFPELLADIEKAL